MSLALLGCNAALVMVLMSTLWIISVARRSASIVDPFWSLSRVATASAMRGSGRGAPWRAASEAGAPVAHDDVAVDGARGSRDPAFADSAVE